MNSSGGNDRTKYLAETQFGKEQGEVTLPAGSAGQRNKTESWSLTSAGWSSCSVESIAVAKASA